MRIWPILLVSICFLFWIIVDGFGLYFNLHSSSLPTGFYQRLDQVAEKGMYAATCLTPEIARYGLDRGYLLKGSCTTGIQPVMKKIYALDGDTVVMNSDKIIINGERSNDLEILERDSRGREVKRFFSGICRLDKNEYWLMSDYKVNSWDSRYWGPVKIEFVLKPVLTF
jgi:conjugative transfer signal peptidase TraF